MLRAVIQSLLPGSPPDLSAEAGALSQQVHARLFTQGSGPEEANEHCPACNVIVPLLDITKAVCANGHHWSKPILIVWEARL